MPRKKTSGFAIASLVMGIGSYVCLPLVMPVLAIIFSIIARREINKSGGRLTGSGLATAGLSLGIVALVLLVIAAAVIMPVAIIRVGRTRTITRTVEKMGAAAVSADVEMKSGNLNINGGSSYLMSGKFTYNVTGWKPAISFVPGETKSELKVSQPNIYGLFPFWNAHNNWEISFSNDIPCDMVVHRISGNSNLDLNPLLINNFDIDSTSGNVKVNLAGHKPSLEHVKAKLISGNLKLDMTGDYPSQVDLSTDAISGNSTIDLRGNWEADLHGKISTTSGNIMIYLPRDVGIYVATDTVSGKVDASGLSIADKGRNKTFKNSSYGTAKTTIILDVKNVSGNIDLVMPEHSGISE